MPTIDPIEILLAHDRWATQQILNACIPLTPDQFHKRFEMGPGSLHDTLTHMLAAMQIWEDRLAQREPRQHLDPKIHRTPEDLLKLEGEIAAAFHTIARAHPLDGQITTTRAGKTYAFPRVSVITHVATHGMHHRAQCLNMLRHLGVQPLPPSSVVEWVRYVDAPQ